MLGAGPGGLCRGRHRFELGSRGGAGRGEGNCSRMAAENAFVVAGAFSRRCQKKEFNRNVSESFALSLCQSSGKPGIWNENSPGIGHRY